MRNRINFPVAGCVVSILEWIRSSIDKALLSPWLSHGVSDPPVPDASEVEDRPFSSTMPPIPPPNDQPHDFLVFLSFRGEDTRNGFTSHLYDALSERSLKTFKDSKDLHKGETIDRLFGYIERSKVFVPIISERYAESKWCLKEIAKIVDCVGDGRLILPIFFGVEPSHVRHQTGPFEKHFKAYENDKNMDKEEVKKWRDALRAVSNLSGHSVINGDKSKLIGEVISDILRHLDSRRLTVADHPVGLESRIEDMMKLLQIERDDVNKMVGIVGTGGIGKTTIAKAVFNGLRSEFPLATFLPGVREAWKTALKGALMMQIVKDLLKDEVSPVHDIATGKGLLAGRVPCKKVLIVLDDVDRIEQFQDLIGLALFGRFTAGSRIIITSRDQKVLRSCGVERGDFYKPVLLDAEQSLVLFRSYAFPNCDRPDDKYLDTSKKIVAIAGGLPLALRVFGSCLTNNTDLAEWNDYFDDLKQNRRRGDIHANLRISYDALGDIEQRIFLDIACFFHTNCHREANFLWKSLDWQPESAINELCSKSLISIRDDGGYEMHDLIRDMGRSIVQEGGRRPWMWSRLWTAYDTRKTIDKSPRNEVIEGIDVHGTGKEIFRTEAFGEMTNLRILILDGIGKLEGENFMLPEDLKFLYLRRVKIQSLSSCNFENLIALELHAADEMTQLFVRKSQETQAFEALKFLKIFCHAIRVTPDFSNMPNLEHVEFSFCASLVEVHESIGKLRKLKYLKFLQFLNVEKLPDAICELSSLETLIIRQFPRLESLPERLGELERLNLLHLEDLAITSIPSSIGQLTRLREMYLRKLERLHDLPDSISSLNDLQVFDSEGTDESQDEERCSCNQ
ncbi:unnamed protein product [Victoria cruziana]